MPASAWEWLDTIDIAEEFGAPIRTFQSAPRCFAGAALRAFRISLNAFQGTPASPATIHRAWKLFLLTPRLLFHRPPGPGRLERGALCQRADDFLAGRWPALLTSARACRVTRPAPPSPTTDGDEAATRRRLRACSQVQSGDLSRARATLTSSPLAPGTAATLEALRDPNRRPPTLRRPIPEEVLTSCTPAPVQLSARELADSLRTAKRGAAPGLSGATAEHYKLLLEDPAAFQLFVSLANALAQADAPADILQALSLARLTALQKPGGGVRGIATGDALRRLVSRTLARHFADVLDQATRPFQFALKARAGTDALAGLITAALDLDPECTVVSLDGRAAYDSISRAAFLSQVRSSVPSLLPFAKAFYGQTSTYYWWDDGGTRHTIAQGEGCEQGDALAPALFALGQHAGLLAAATQLQPGETLAAYLDDLYILTSPARARTCLDAVSRAVHAHSGIAANLGKTRVFHRAGGPPPPGIRDLGPDVWCGGEQPPEECGFLALGTPIGTPAYVQAASADRVRRQADFLRELPHLPDLQAAWLLLTYCAAPRAQHLLRTVPPTLSATAAAAHDEAVWETLARLLQEPAPTALPLSSRTLAFLPARLGGLGLYAAARLAPAAYWASWADALPVLRQRVPALAERLTAILSTAAASGTTCLHEAAACGTHLDAQGWTARPPWDILLSGPRAPPPLDEAEPGLFRHGWQQPAALVLHTAHRAREVMPTLPEAEQALLRSQSGPHAAAWLTAIPTDPGTTLSPEEMQVALRRRLRLPLPLASRHCGGDRGYGCGAPSDPFGDHATACHRTGLLARRAKLVELAWLRVAREAVGAEGRVIAQPLLGDTNIPGVSCSDQRRLDIVIYGADPHGVALCGDATLVAPLNRRGQPTHGSATRDGAALEAAERRKHRAYPELLRGGPQRLLVLGAETGGRWSRDCFSLMRILLTARSRRTPSLVRRAMCSGWQRRWWALLACAVQRAVAMSATSAPWASTPPTPATPPCPLAILSLADFAGPSRLGFPA